MLDLYNVVLAVLLFASPWLFSLSNGTARIDFWISGVAVVASRSRRSSPMRIGRTGQSPVRPLVDWLALDIGLLEARAMHSPVAIGAFVTFLALLELWLIYEKAHPFPSSGTPKQNQ